MARHRIAALALAAFALTASACAGAGTDAPPTSPPTTDAASPAPTSTGGQELEDGRHFGFVMAVDAEARTVEYDDAEFLTGEEAQDAAEEDGVVEPGEYPPNDYYIRNTDETLHSLAFADEVSVTLVGWSDCCDKPQEGTLEEWLASFEPDADTTGDYHGPTSPWWLTIEGGVVVAVEEQYLP